MPTLRVAQSPDAARRGQSIVLDASPMTIGRGSDSRLRLDDPGASRHHAVIHRAPEGVWIEDLGSSNGTFVNDVAVSKAWLQAGDRIRVGETLLELGDPAAVAAVAPPGVGAPPAPPPRPAVEAGAPRRKAPLAAALVGGLAALVGLAILVVVLVGHRSSTGKSAATDTRAFAQAALRFRFQAISSFDAAVQACAEPSGKAALARIGEALWPVTDPGPGWSQLLGTSLVCLGSGRGDTRVAAYYHPWSDVFLMTTWSLPAGGSPRLTDAEMLMGDCVRRGGEAPLDGGWHWKDGRTYPPFAIGQSAASTVAAFDQRFRAEGRAGGSWQDAIPGLRDTARQEGNRYGAGVLVMRNLAEMAPLLDPSAADPVARAVRTRLTGIVPLLQAGRFPEVVREARQTLPEASASLRSLTADDWKRFRVAAYWASERSAIVALSKLDQTDRYLALVFTIELGAARLQRIDTLSFGAFRSAPGTT